MDFNFTSQICTTKEQSERLLALGLKKETADMAHIAFGGGGMMIRPYEWLSTTGVDMENFIPAWSLHRLIQIANAMFDETAENWYDDIIDTIQSFILLGCLNEEYLNMDIVNAVRENYNMKLLKNEKDS
jgi:hypothetical protein